MSEGATLTYHNVQMKLFTSIASVAAVIAAIVAANPAQAQYYNYNSNRIGNSTFTNVYGSGGYNYNGSSTRIGGTTFITGSDNYGNIYSGSCNRFGSYTSCNMR